MAKEIKKRVFKNTEFNPNYKGTFKEFEKTHAKIFDASEMKQAYDVAIGKADNTEETKS